MTDSTDAAVALVVAFARAAHPDDPEAMAATALRMVDGIVDVARPPVSNESPCLSAAELEQRLASPGAKWDNQAGDRICG